jgi:hypothetical protein
MGAALLVLSGFASTNATMGELPALVVTQLPLETPAEKSGPRSGGMLPAAWGEGARLVLVHAGRVERVLTAGFHSAADPDVSLDGKSILFAGQKQAGDSWAVYEMDVESGDVREIYATDDDLRHPIYLPTVYTIIPDPTKGTAPRHHIGVVRIFHDSRNEYGDAPTSSIYSVKLDGTDPRRLTYDLSNEMAPTVLRDGRVVYSAWQRSSLRRGYEGRISLLGIDADGLDPAIFSADEGQRIKLTPCATPTADRLVVFVASRTTTWDGAGSLASVSLRRNLHSYRSITEARQGLFAYPSPLPDGSILASHRDQNGHGNLSIVRVDPASGRVVPVFDDPAYHDMQPRALVARKGPDQRSSAVKDPDDTSAAHEGTSAVPEAKLYGLNVYQNDLGVDLPPGTIATLRVLEGIPLRPSGAAEPRTDVASAIPGASERGLAPMAARRLIGEAPVEKDGSFHVSVPAERPIELQILDQDGLALRSSGWIWVHYRGQQGCVGCHEDGELSPSNRFVDALRRPANRLVLPPESRRTVDFRHQIAPIVAARCASCHKDDHPLRLDAGVGPSGLFPRAYESLMAGLSPEGDGGRVVGRYVHPGSARTSPVVWHILGRNTSRPWDGAITLDEPHPMPPKTPLTDIERRLFIEWIDTGALYDATLDIVDSATSPERHEGGHP